MGYRLAGTSYGSSSGAQVTLPSGIAMSIAPSPVDGYWFHDDFSMSTLSVVLNTGAGTGFPICNAVGEPGTLQQAVAVAGVDGTRAQIGASGTPWTCFGGGSTFYFRARVAISAVPDGVQNTIVRLGFGDATTGLADNTDGAYLELDRATHGDNNWRLCASNNAVRTKVDTGIAVAAAMTLVEIEINSDGTLVQCEIGGVAGSNTVATNIPVTTARGFQALIQTSKQLGATSRSLFVDYYSVGVKFATAR